MTEDNTGIFGGQPGALSDYIGRVRNSGCPVVQDNQKSSRTTKYESLEHFGCPYGQPRLPLKQFCH